MRKVYISIGQYLAAPEGEGYAQGGKAGSVEGSRTDIHQSILWLILMVSGWLCEVIGNEEGIQK